MRQDDAAVKPSIAEKSRGTWTSLEEKFHNGDAGGKGDGQEIPENILIEVFWCTQLMKDKVIRSPRTWVKLLSSQVYRYRS